MKENPETSDDSLNAKKDGNAIVPQPALNQPQPQPAKPAFHRRRIGSITFAAILIVAFCIWLRNRQGNHDDQNVAEASTLPGDVVVVDERQLQQIAVEPVKAQQITSDWQTTGRIAFDENHLTPVAPPYAGRVRELLAAKGDHVTKGQPLLKLESPDLVATQADLASARSDVAKAKIDFDIAQASAERERDLYSHKAVATKDLQQAEADLARAQDEKKRAAATLATVESRLEIFGKRPQDITRSDSSVDRDILICAPISGTIVDRKVGPGQYVRPDAADPLFLISDLTSLWVLADVFESDLALVRLQTPVEISTEAYPDMKIPGKISYISPVVDPATRTVRVRCLLNNKSGLFKPDMFAKIRISGAATQSLPFVPSSAVITEGNSSIVFVEEAPKRFQRRQITVKRELQGYAAISSGLLADERVVTRGGLLLNEALK